MDFQVLRAGDLVEIEARPGDAAQRVQRAAGGGLIGSGCEQSWEAYKFGLDPMGCCTAFWEDLDADVPEGVHFTSIYSRSDGVLHWRACLDPQARHVEVSSSHCGMAVNPVVYREIGHALALGTPAAFALATRRFPGRALEKAVKGMLPKGPLGYAMVKKLKVYAGDTHPHTAQQPKPLEI